MTGPLALAVAVAMPRTTIAQAAPSPNVAPQKAAAGDPAGMAEMFVDLWLRADASMPDSPEVAAVRALVPDSDLPRRPRAKEQAPAASRVIAVRTSPSPGGWTVVVAAVSEQPAEGVPLVRYFAVAGTGGKDGGPLRVAGAPGEVAAPESAPAAEETFTHPVNSTGVLAGSLGEFVRAYLGGGQGAGVERYLSPGVHVATPLTAAYERVNVEDLAADSRAALAEGAPADGARARVRVRVTGVDRAGVRWPLVYRLEVTARASRWEISALDAATATSPSPTGSKSLASAAVVSPAPVVSGGVR
ncbi:conjugal transfer protein [Streptomyces sp. NBC_01565]|uniref:conjugal transfer protein n=1 Tax=unclassified Streptomyces TaxID=2593676 RepID=UPI0022571F8B|nr:conjugal transfer protein [Streptomyces sp. NBC_01565]MCX4546894.1 conjugal transfer protein [Streptomyces sp. NBC_01565]